MAYRCSPASEDWIWRSALGSDPSPTAKSTPTHKQYSSPEWLMVCFQPLPSGLMLEHSPCENCQKWTSFTADSPARTSALQELERAWREAEADCFFTLSASLASADPDSFSWKTSQLSLFGGLTEFSWNSMRWGTMRDGQLFQPQKWEPRTSESESGYWPTPVANDDNKSPQAHMIMKANMPGGPRHKPTSLNVMVKGIALGMWPTPIASDSNKDPTGSLSRMARRRLLPTPTASGGGSNTGGGGRPTGTGTYRPSLSTMAQKNLWPTPTVEGNWNRAGASEKSGDGLETAVKRWPTATATARDWKSGSKGTQGNSRPLSEEVGGQLNPTWVEWLMGYPLEWTVCADWAMQWFRSQRGKRSCGSQDV